jgi:hypothetical protein
MKTYAEKLKDPRWQRKRLEVMRRDQFACQICGESQMTLHVHHRYYIQGRMPWEYPNWSFKTLCANCHSDVHDQSLYDDEGRIGYDEFEDIFDFLGADDPESRMEIWDLSVELAMMASQMGGKPSDAIKKIIPIIQEMIQALPEMEPQNNH